MNPQAVGKTAPYLAELAGITVPPDTRILVARERGTGMACPYSMEKLCPVLGFYVMDSEDEVLAKCMEILDFEGRGHTFSIHAEEERVIRKFAEKIPVSRFLVNTPAALGGIGAAVDDPHRQRGAGRQRRGARPGPGPDLRLWGGGGKRFLQ